MVQGDFKRILHKLEYEERCSVIGSLADLTIDLGHLCYDQSVGCRLDWLLSPLDTLLWPGAGSYYRVFW